MKVTIAGVFRATMVVAALMHLGPSSSSSWAAEAKRPEARRYEAKRAEPRSSQLVVPAAPNNSEPAAENKDVAPASKAVREFASCIAESGAKFYGAHWCGHCRKQKEMFGSAASSLPYVECSEPGSRAQLPACKGITSYPTWRFANGPIRKGALSMDGLAFATGCESP